VNEITFTASVYKVQTNVADRGVRITLDLPEDAIPQMAMLAECKRQGIPLFFTAKVEGEPIKTGKKRNDRQRA